MNKIKKTIVWGVVLSSVNLFALNGRQIMQKNDKLPSAKSSKGKSVLVILKGTRKVLKKFNTIGKDYGKKSRSRITFTKPTRIELLTHSAPGQDSRQWMKLSSGKIRKISGSDKSGSFVNSHFYYEDLSDREITDYRYKKLSDVKVKGIPCYQVQSVKKRGTKVYSKIISYLRKKDFVMVQVDFYERGRHTKTLRAEKIKKIQGIFTPRKLVMQRTDGRGKSILYVQSIRYNIRVSNHKLTRAGL